MTNYASIATAGIYTPDHLLAGNADLLVSIKVTIAAGNNLTRGSVLGKITTGGKYNLSTTAATDGSEQPTAVLAENCNAASYDMEAIAYIRGDFNAAGLTLGEGHTAASLRDSVRGMGITII